MPHKKSDHGGAFFIVYKKNSMAVDSDYAFGLYNGPCPTKSACLCNRIVNNCPYNKRVPIHYSVPGLFYLFIQAYPFLSFFKVDRGSFFVGAGAGTLNVAATFAAS